MREEDAETRFKLDSRIRDDFKKIEREFLEHNVRWNLDHSFKYTLCHEIFMWMLQLEFTDEEAEFILNFKDNIVSEVYANYLHMDAVGLNQDVTDAISSLF